jgi:hypothetical protein
VYYGIKKAGFGGYLGVSQRKAKKKELQALGKRSSGYHNEVRKGEREGV